MRVLIEEKSESCFDRDVKVVRRVLENKSGGTRDLKAFDCVRQHVAEYSGRLTGVFGMSRVPLVQKMITAGVIVEEGVSLLAMLEPMVIGLNLDDLPGQIPDEARALRQSVRDLRQLVEKKDEQRRDILSRLSPKEQGL